MASLSSQYLASSISLTIYYINIIIIIIFCVNNSVRAIFVFSYICTEGRRTIRVNKIYCHLICIRHHIKLAAEGSFQPP